VPANLEHLLAHLISNDKLVEKTTAQVQKLADKARKAEEGRRKAVAEQASRQAKLDKRAKQDAERAAKKTADEQRKAAAGPAG